MTNHYRFLLITSRFNEDITSRLLEGARQRLLEDAISEQNIQTLSVPGAYELPVVAAQAAEKGQWNAIICLGAVIQGETDHYHYVCDAVAHGLMDVSVRYKTPVLFGVLTTQTREQALARAQLGTAASEKTPGAKVKIYNKGASCAEAALMTLKTLGELNGFAV